MPDLWLIFFISFLVAFFTLDAYRWFFSTRPTFSQKMRDWTAKHPLLSFFIGLFIGTVAGHFWW